MTGVAMVMAARDAPRMLHCEFCNRDGAKSRDGLLVGQSVLRTGLTLVLARDHCSKV